MFFEDAHDGVLHRRPGALVTRLTSIETRPQAVAAGVRFPGKCAMRLIRIKPLGILGIYLPVRVVVGPDRSRVRLRRSRIRCL